MSRLKQWWAERVPVDGEQLKALTNEPVPNHLKSWWFCLGGTPAYLFVVQIITGILLAFYYQAAPGAAYESVEYITNQVAFGWYIRSIHKWAATLMIAAVILHQIRVYFTGAYRRPREVNWVIGMGLLLVTLMIGFTGYCLVFEQLSFWGAQVGANIAEATPVIGGPIKHLILGGESYNERTLSRFYVMHAMILPGTLILLLVLHIALIRLHGVTEFQFGNEDPEKPQTFNFFPDHVLSELSLGLVLMVVLSALATLWPADMGLKADPLTTPDVIKPEWFFYVSFRWLKWFPLTGAVLSSGLIVFSMIVWPWIDSFLRRVTKIEEISVYIGIVATCLLIGLTVLEAVVAH